jgi:hypothetical protein
MAYTPRMWKRLPIYALRALVASLVLLLAGSRLDAASVAAAGSLPPVATATATLDVQVRAGFDGFYKAGGWLPVTALARNDGPPLDGRLELAADPPAIASGSYSTAAILPTHSSKRLTFVAPAPAVDRQRTVTLAAGGSTLLSQTVAVSALSPQDYLYGIISPNRDALDLLRGVRQFDGTVSIAHLTLEDLPAGGPALNDVDALVLDGTATSELSTGQRATLLGWVGSGGQLVLAGGVGAAETLGGLSAIAPVSLTGTAVLDVGAALTPWTHSTIADATTVAVSRPTVGSVVRLQAGTVPLVVDRPFGAGWVTFLAMPAATPALHDAPGGTLAWAHILTAGRHSLDGVAPSQQGYGAGTANAVYSLPQAVLPSGSLLAWLIFGYILVVGPGNYLLMRALDRREFLWLTIPVISVLFAGGSYLLAQQLKGSDVIVNTVTIARHSAAATASATTITGAVGIFSPGRTSYNMSIGSGLGIAPLDPGFDTSDQSVLTVVGEGATTHVQHIEVAKWSMQAFAVHGMAGESPAPPLVDSSLSLAGPVISGWIRNSSSQLLQDVTLDVGNDTVGLQDLAPGEQRTVRLVLSGSVAPVSGSPGRPLPGPAGGNVGDNDARRALLESVLNTGIPTPGGYSEAGGLVGGARILAFTDAAPFSVDVQGQRIQQHNTTLELLPVEVHLPPVGYTLPYGLAQREVLQDSGVANQFGGPGLPLGSTAVFQFHLPGNAAGLTWNALHVRLNFGAPRPGAGGGASVALYNWQAAAWEAQPGFPQGVFTVPQPARYIDPRGLIRLQITGGNGKGVLQTLDVALDGPP